jgi:hypothetical protein
MRLLWSLTIGALPLVAGAAEPLSPPVPPNDALVHRLCEYNVIGPVPGKHRSLICDLAGRPAVLIYARAFDPALPALLAKLDAIALRDPEKKMRSACVLITEDEDDRDGLRLLAHRLKLEATWLMTHPPAPGECYFGSNPSRSRLPAEAHVTVLILSKLRVQSSYAYRQRELSDSEIEKIIGAARALLPRQP